MNKLERDILNGIAAYIAELTTLLIVNAGYKWRFYFDENEQQKIKDGLKNFISGAIKNAKMQ